MKLVFRGHDERYVVEQSLMNLFPGELPVYEPITPGDDSWAVISLEETGDLCRVAVSLCRGGKTTEQTYQEPLSGGDFQREGLRRHAVGACFFLAARAVTGVTPPWGMLTGVRPDKPVTWALEDGKSPEEARAYLEEHYFVTPSRAALALETGATAAKAARRLEKRDIDVYVGIPFCPTRCAYCSFVSQSVERSFALVPPYVDALCGEISAGGEMVRRAGLRVRTFYMGGGTPTTLTAEQMDRVLTAFETSFDRTACEEITVEAGRPDTITADKLGVLRVHGIGRISVNPQTMEDHVLRSMGRAHTAVQIEQAMELARARFGGLVNMDLIAGLPTDSLEGFQRTLDRVLAMGAANITVHTLALKKGARLMERPEDLCTPATVSDMLALGEHALRAAGYQPYYLYRQKYMSGSFENVGWCKPGTECAYNIIMMEELQTVLSLGAGGVTKLVDPSTGKITRLANPKFPKEYLDSWEKLAAGKLSAAQFQARLYQAP